MKTAVISVLSVLFVVVVGYILFAFWPYIFAETIRGPVVKVEKLMDSLALIARGGRTQR